MMWIIRAIPFVIFFVVIIVGLKNWVDSFDTPFPLDGMKLCSRCDYYQTKESFSLKLISHDGLQVRCKLCSAKYNREKRLEKKLKEKI